MFRLKTANYLFILIISIEASVWIASALEPTEASIQHDRMISTLTSTSNLDPTQEKTFESSFFETPLAVVPDPEPIQEDTHIQNIPKNDPIFRSSEAESNLFSQSGPQDGLSSQTPKKGRREESNTENESLSTDSDSSSSSGFPLWVVGLTLAILACAFNALGFVFQRRGHQSLENKCPWLVGGLLMLLAGGLLDFASLGFAAQSLVAATGGLTLVCNVIFAKWVLNEPVSGRVLLGTLIVLAGCAVTVAFSSHHSEARTGEELAALLGTSGAVIYFFVSDGAIVISLFAIITMEACYFTEEHRSWQHRFLVSCFSSFGRNSSSSFSHRKNSTSAAILTLEQPAAQNEGRSISGSGVGCPGNVPELVIDPKETKESPGIDADKPIELDSDKADEDETPKDGLVRPWVIGMGDEPRVVNVHGVLHAWVSGIAGSQSVLFGKICAEILVNAADQSEFHYFVFFSSAVGMGLFVWLQLHSMNRALKYHETILIVPAYQTFWTLGGIACGAAIFDEFAGAAVSQLVAYPFGMTVMLGGVWLLIISQKSSQTELVDSEHDHSNTEDNAAGASSHVDVVVV